MREGESPICLRWEQVAYGANNSASFALDHTLLELIILPTFYYETSLRTVAATSIKSCGFGLVKIRLPVVLSRKALFFRRASNELKPCCFSGSKINQSLIFTARLKACEGLN